MTQIMNLHKNSTTMNTVPGMHEVVFLLDVDNTLLDNDSAQTDYIAEIRKQVSPEAASRYWEIFKQLALELGYADYLGALQRYRLDHMYDHRLLHISSYLLDYPFADRLYDKALELITHWQSFGQVAILTDGDVVFQPRKIIRSGLYEAVSGEVMVFMHKERELEQIEQRYPARHYVMVDDKLRLLTAIKAHWQDRVTTVFARQGHYAAEPQTLATYPPADISVGHIRELLDLPLETLVNAGKGTEETRT